MAGGNIDNLYITVSASAKGASNALEKVAKALEKIAGLSSNSGLKELAEQLDTATKSASGLNNELKGIKGIHANIDTATESTNKLTGAMGELWKMMKKVATLSAAIALFKKGYALATDLFETANYFNVVMGQYSEEAYAYAQKVSDGLGIDEAQWMDAQATFMSLGTTFGIVSDDAYLMSKNLTQLAYDMSSLKNVKPEVAIQKMRAAFAGELEPIRNWGVDLSKVNIQLVALKNNITKPFDQMSQAEKAQLRYITIMEQLEYGMEDLSRTLESPGNQLRLLETAVKKAARAFGNIFIPILNKVIPVLITVANVIRFLFERIAEFFGFEYPKIENWDRYSDSVGGMADNMDEATGAAKRLKKQLAGFDEINNLTTNQGGSGNSASGYFGDLDLPTYETFGKSFLGDALDQKVANITEKLNGLLAVLKGFAPAIAAIVAAILVFKGIYAGMAFINNLTNGVKTLWAVLSANPLVTIISLVAGLVAAFITAYKTNDVFREKVDAFFGSIKEKVTAAWNTIKPFFNKIAEGAKVAWDKIKSFFGNIGTWFSTKFGEVKDKVAEKWESVKKGASDAWAAIKEKFSPVTTWFSDKFGKAWEAVKKVFSGEISFKDIKDAVGTAFTKMINKLIEGLNKVIKAPFDLLNKTLNKIREISIFGFQPFINLWGVSPISIPQIPTIQLATGGVVNQPTTALIGENGAEAVVPLENNTQWIAKVANEINAYQDDSQIVIMLERVVEAINNKDLEVSIGDSDIYNANKRETNRQNRLLGRAY